MYVSLHKDLPYDKLQDISKEVFKEICRKEKLADNTQDWKADNRQSLASFFD